MIEDLVALALIGYVNSQLKECAHRRQWRDSVQRLCRLLDTVHIRNQPNGIAAAHSPHDRWWKAIRQRCPEVEEDDFVGAGMEPWPRRVEREFRADGPEAAERAVVRGMRIPFESPWVLRKVSAKGSLPWASSWRSDRSRGLRRMLDVKCSVARSVIGRWIDLASAAAWLPARVTLPVMPLRSVRITLVKLTRPEFSTRMSSVAAARNCRQGEMRLAEAAVERADEFLIDVDLRVIVEAVDRKFAAGAGCELRAVENVAVGLVEVFHGEQLVGLDRLRQILPQRRDSSVREIGYVPRELAAESQADVLPVTRAMTSRKSVNFCRGSPLSSSGAS